VNPYFRFGAVFNAPHTAANHAELARRRVQHTPGSSSPSLAKNMNRRRSCSDSPLLSWIPIRFRYSGLSGQRTMWMVLE
jgi:hypothetical protein